jgi:hypothetical protein
LEQSDHVGTVDRVIAPVGVRLVQSCESLCDDLRRAIGLTLFRIELDRRATPLVITLRSRDPSPYDPRHTWMRPAVPARIQLLLLVGGRRVGELAVEDDRRATYPPEAYREAEHIAERYTNVIAGLINEAQL